MHVAPKPGFRFVKLDVEYFDHPKIDPLSNDAKVLHMYLICRSGRLKSDGEVSLSAAKSQGREALDELVEAGLLSTEDSKTYRVNDYLDYQTPKEQIEQKSVDRAAAGARGGHVKNHANKLLYDEMCLYCQEAAVKAESWLKHPDLMCKQQA